MSDPAATRPGEIAGNQADAEDAAACALEKLEADDGEKAETT